MAVATGIVGAVVAGLILLWIQGKTGPLAGASVTLVFVCLALLLVTQAGLLHWGLETQPVAVGSMERAVGTDRQPLSGPNVAETHRDDEQLNIIVFNAIRTDSLFPLIDTDFYWTVNQLKRVLNDCSIDAREYWENRRYRQRTEVHFNGARTEAAAREIAELLPGQQDVRSLEQSRLWGMHSDRDIVILLGGDALYVERMLADRRDTQPCPRLSGQLGSRLRTKADRGPRSRRRAIAVYPNPLC